jgi:hypothetical protein
MASFDIDVRVVGTDQPGFLFLDIWRADHTMFYAKPERGVHYGEIRIQGQPCCITYIPYTPGVPARLFGWVSGGGGAGDIPGGGSGYAHFEMYVRFASDANGGPVPGTRVTIIPEPSSITLFAIGVLLCTFAKRLRLRN